MIEADDFEAKHPRDKNGKFIKGFGLKKFDLKHPASEHLYFYKASGYRDINDHLSGRSKGSEDTKESIKQIDKAFKESYLDNDETLYRGINDKELASNAESYVGGSMTANEYQSTSRNPNIASSFGGNPNKEDQVILSISAKAGTPAINMDQFESGDSKQEQEVLLNRGTEFSVDSVERNPGQPVIIRVSVKK